MKLGDVEKLSGVLADAALREIMPRFGRLAAEEIRAKSGPLDLVTAADVAAERFITAELLHRFPGCVVVGEEAASADAGLLEKLVDADLAFVVDPIDGTANYAAGLPLFGCMAAAMVRGEIVAGVIHDPMTGTSACALRGEGAWTDTPAGRRDLRVAASVPVGEMSGVVKWRFLPDAIRRRVHAALPKLAAGFDLRCAAHEYRLAASGNCHFLVYGKLMPWDHAPGVLLHREAGGYAAHFDGSAYHVGRTEGGLICAPDAESWAAIVAAFASA